ncbi:hypothetical protein IL306_001711, partial [Fusarium sp. DS 682]
TWLEPVKKQAIQDHLDSLRIRLKDFAKNLTHLPPDLLSSYCPKEQWEERQDSLMDLKNDIPLSEWCFLPYDAHDLFMELAKKFKALVVDALKCHVQLFRAVIMEDDPAQSEQSITLGHSHEGSVTGVPEKVSGETSVYSQEAIQHVRDSFREAEIKVWTEKQIDAYDRYLQLPVTDDVVSFALVEYKACRCLRCPLPPGLSLYALSLNTDTNSWWVEQVNPAAPEDTCPSVRIEVITITRHMLRIYCKGAPLKKEVPTTHPSLANLNLDFEDFTLPESEIVVAWKFFGSDAWMDRYGHLVPEELSLRI